MFKFFRNSTSFKEALGPVNKVALSDHFKLYEFECHGKSCCGNTVKIHPALIAGLEKLRAAIHEKFPDTPALLKLTCSYRCKKHNAGIGGVKNSEHMFGLAADISTIVYPLPEIEVAKLAEKISEFKRIGVYGKSKYKKGKFVSIRGYHNKTGFIHVGVADKYVKGIKLPSKWGDWV